jgi:Arf-GAP with SH3 domain, ANK repeat and PH domain-containing protein
LPSISSAHYLDLSLTVSQLSPQRRPSKLSIPADPFDSRLESVPESPEVPSSIVSGGSSDIPRDYTKSPPPAAYHEPIQLSNPRADELLLKEVEDGPLFRSRIIGLEKKTAALKAKTKKIISRAETLLDAQNAYFEADRRWYESLQQLASTNSKAVQPLLTNYLDASYIQNQAFHRRKVAHLQILINELRRIYDYDIKAAETKKRAFEEESQDYYHSMTKYLAKNDTANTNKQKEKDSKHQSRRKDYELKRFDYWSYMNDLNGGRKEQEILHHLTQYMDSQLNTLTDATRTERELKPGLDSLLQQVEEASREFKLMRTEREQRRRDLEMGKSVAGEGWQLDTSSSPPTFADAPFQPIETVISDPVTIPAPVGQAVTKGQWLSDVEDEEKVIPPRRKKEGILFALSRPANHNDPKVMPKLNWHKYVCTCLSLITGTGLYLTKDSCGNTQTGSEVPNFIMILFT